VMRCMGNSKCELIIAPRTRSLLSFTAASGKPTAALVQEAELLPAQHLTDICAHLNGFHKLDAAIPADDRKRIVYVMRFVPQHILQHALVTR
jgi:hypothetical protein